MKSCSAIAWLLLAVAALGGGPVVADQTPMSSVVFRPEQPASISAQRSMLLRRFPLVQTGYAAPEVIDPGIPHQEPVAVATLTLHDLEQIALQSNPTLAQAWMAVRAAQGSYLQAGLYPNPAIGYAGGDMGLEGTSGQQGATIGQEIVTSGKLRLGRAVAGHEVQQARHGFELQRQRVLSDVRSGYYEVLLAEKMIDVNSELARIAQEILTGTEKALALKEVSRADALQVRVQAEKARLALEDAENRHRVAWHQLAAVLGQPEMPAAPLAGNVDTDLPTFDREETFMRLLTQSPELAQARAGVQRARCELALQYARRVPNLEVAVWGKHDATTSESLADVGIELPLPLFDRNQGNIVKGQAELIAAQREVRRIELDLYRRFSAAFGQYINARRQVGAYARTIIPNDQESLRLIRAGRLEGEFGYLTLLTAQRTYFNDSLEYLANLREFWARSIELEGLLLSGGLEKPE